MNLKRKKKGFTIVELVIVLAVIGILAAILIPTFVNVVNRANEAKDKSLVYNLNEALILEEIDHNGKYATMHDTLQAMDKNQGFGIDRIRVKSKNSEVLWDSVNNRFVMVTTDKNNNKSYYNGTDEIDYPNSTVKEIDLWAISDTINPTYSTYYTGTAESVTTSKGFDAGSTTVTSVTYEHTGTTQDVVIRTNSANTSLTVNAPNDTVNHYGNAGNVDIIAVANKSYHENGTVAFVEIAKGRIALENSSNVTHIHVSTQVTAVNAETGDKTKTANTFDQVIVALASGVEVPEFSRDEVALSSIGAEGKLVVEIEKANNKSDYVYLYQQGLLGQIRVTTGDSTNSGTNVEAKAIDVNAKRGTDETLETNTSSIAEDIANNLKSGSTVTEEQIVAGTVDTTEVEESGLNEEAKEEKKEIVVNDAVIAETNDIQKICEHNFENDVCSICGFVKFDGAKVGGVQYPSVEDAIEVGIQTGETVVIGDDCVISFNSTYAHTIPQGKSLTIDINGKNIKIYSLIQENTSAFLFNNGGTITLMDSTADSSGVGTGKVSMIVSDPDLQGIPGYASNFIRNFGEVNILSGWYHNEGSGFAAYVVDNDAENVEWQSWASAGTDVKLSVLGGKLTSNVSVSIRMYLDNDSAQKNTNTISISNATIGSLWIQDTNAKAAGGNLSIKDSNITNDLPLGWYGRAQNVSVSLSNSSIKNFEYLFNLNAAGNTLQVNNCVFVGSFTSNSPIKVINSKSGPFSVNVSSYCIDGLFSKLVDGKYVLRPISEATEEDYEAFIGEQGYWTLSEAINSSNGNTVRLTKDYNGYLYFNDGGTYSLDLNGHNITDPHASGNSDAVNVYNNTTLVITDSSTGTKGTISSVDGNAIWTGSSSTDTSCITIDGGVKLVGKTNCIESSDGTTTIIINSAVTEGGFNINEGSTLTDKR